MYTVKNHMTSVLYINERINKNDKEENEKKRYLLHCQIPDPMRSDSNMTAKQLLKPLKRSQLMRSDNLYFRNFVSISLRQTSSKLKLINTFYCRSLPLSSANWLFFASYVVFLIKYILCTICQHGNKLLKKSR